MGRQRARERADRPRAGQVGDVTEHDRRAAGEGSEDEVGGGRNGPGAGSDRARRTARGGGRQGGGGTAGRWRGAVVGAVAGFGEGLAPPIPGTEQAPRRSSTANPAANLPALA